MKVLSDLKQSLDQEGYKFSIFKASHLKSVKEGMENLKENNLVDESIFIEYLMNFEYDLDQRLQNAKSIIIIAMPHYSSKIKFVHENKEIEVVLPPQYAYPKLEEKAYNIVKPLLNRENIELKSVKLPLKYLAVMSGLCKIGRNNLCYSENAGTFIRLTGYITNFETDYDQWPGIFQMSSCKKCSLCLNNCPTNAIDKERNLIYAQKCLTHFNENTLEMPEWIESKSHNAIVGCMRCQEICPHNKKFLDSIDYEIEFDETETEMILRMVNYSTLEPKTQDKIHLLGLTEYYDVLSRNLTFLINNKYHVS